MYKVTPTDMALGTRLLGLRRAGLLFAAPALPGRDQPYRLVGTHAAHGTRGVQRPEDHATTSEQELCWLDEATFALPPGAQHLGFLPGSAVGDREGEATAHHLPCLRQGVDAGGADSRPKGLQLRFLVLIRGSLPHTVGSPVAQVEEDGGIVGRHLVREANRAALHKLQRERGEPVPLLEFLAHVSSHKPNMAPFLLANGP